MRSAITSRSVSPSFAGKTMLAVVLLGGAMFLSGCNTTAGAGQDVSATGHAITNTADKVKSGL